MVGTISFLPIIKFNSTPHNQIHVLFLHCDFKKNFFHLVFLVIQCTGNESFDVFSCFFFDFLTIICEDNPKIRFFDGE